MPAVLNDFASRKLDECHRQLGKSAALGMDGVIRGELVEAYTDSNEEDWDGFGAQPVNFETLAQTKAFLRKLPLGMERPSIGAEPDGCLTLEWHKSRRRTLSISIDAEGNLTYAALLGPESLCGSVPFVDAIPESILRLLGRVYTC